MNGVDGARRKDERSKRKRILEDELRQISEQRAAIQKQLDALRGGSGRVTAKPVQSTPLNRAGSKRPGVPDGNLPGETPQAKRARIETERVRRVNSLWQQCGTILKALRKVKDAIPFLTPVDPVKLNCLDYFNIVRKPMDLGTVGKKLEDKPEKGQPRPYKSIYEFRDDIRLVFSNCRLYNQVGHAVRAAGDRLSDQWEKRWQQSGLEAKWEEEMRRQKAEELELEGAASMPPDAVPGRIRQLSADLQAATSHADAAGLPRPSIPGPHRPMTFEEKRKLSVRLTSLNDEQLAPVMYMVSECVTQADEDEEVTLDLDELPEDLLWKLHAHMQHLESQQGKAAVRRPPDKSRSVQPQGAAGPSQTNNVDQETSSRPAAPSVGAPSGLQKVNSSSSSSSGDSSSSDGSDDEEVQENDAATLADGRRTAQAHGGALRGPVQAGGGDVTTLVSATRPPPILKHKAGHTANVSVQNVNAWTNLSAPAADGPGSKEEGGAANDGDDLWKEFANKEEQQSAVAKAKQEAEAAQRKQREEELRARHEAAEQQQRQQQREQQQREQAEQRRIQELKAAEARRLEELGAAAGEDGLPALVDNIHDNVNPLGLTMVHNSDDEESNDSDDSE